MNPPFFLYFIHFNSVQICINTPDKLIFYRSDYKKMDEGIIMGIKDRSTLSGSMIVVIVLLLPSLSLTISMGRSDDGDGR